MNNALTSAERASRVIALGLVLLAGAVYGEEKDTYHKQWPQLEREQRFSEAVLIYKRALREYPQEAWFHVYVGHSLKMLKKPDEALVYFEGARTHAKGDAGVLRNVYYGYCSYGTFLGFEKGDWDGAAEWYGKAAKLDPRPAYAHNVMGNALRNAGRLEAAFTAFRKAYDADPSHVHGDLKANFRAGMLEGLRHAREGRKNRLLIDYVTLASEAYPDDAEIILAAVAGALAAGSTQKALAIEKSVTAHPLSVLVRARIDLEKKEKEPRVFEVLDELSRKAEHDYAFDDAVAGVYRSMVDTLDYPAQMSSRYQDRAVDFNTRAVRKYFEVHPHKQLTRLVPPLKSRFRMGQGAGGRSFHNGLTAHFSYDLMQKFGAPVVAVADGEVIHTESSQPDHVEGSPVNLKARANVVKIRHQDGLISSYVHLKKGSVSVRPGQRVRAGQKIGEMGNSGVSGGVHLHFVMHNEKGISVEPRFSGLRAGQSAEGADFRAVEVFGDSKYFEAGP